MDWRDRERQTPDGVRGGIDRGERNGTHGFFVATRLYCTFGTGPVYFTYFFRVLVNCSRRKVWFFTSTILFKNIEYN
jgi:hypothetical protein